MDQHADIPKGAIPEPAGRKLDAIVTQQILVLIRTDLHSITVTSSDHFLLSPRRNNADATQRKR